MPKPKRIDGMVVIKNVEKEGWTESWYPGRQPQDIPHPYRMLLAGRPGSGKSMIAKNMILAASVPFEKIIIIHPFPDSAKEWETVTDDIRAELPALEEFTGEKTLVILDDVEVKGLNKEQIRILDRLFGWASTHRSVSVIITQQDMFQSRPAIRRMLNVICLYNIPDADTRAIAARRVGLKRKTLTHLFKKYLTQADYHDFLCIDMTTKSPYPFRKNLYHPITINEDAED